MPPSDEPFIEPDVQRGLTTWISRILEHAAPDSLIQGGEHSSADRWNPRPRNYQALKEQEAIYKAGGPVTSIIDARSLMTFGTGIEFDTQDTTTTDDQGRTIDEALTELFGDALDLFAIDAGIQSYYAGDAWPEIVETRNGEFSHLNLVDPVTVDPSWDRHGRFTDLRQVIVKDGKPESFPLDTDNVFHFTHSNATGGPMGESLIARNMDEIELFAQNQTQRANAIRLHGSPHYSISVGSEGQSIPDKLMRRVKDQFQSDQVDEKTNWVHGGDIEVSELDSPGFEGMSDITDTDARMLAWAFDFPLEWTNFGNAGLGEGTPAMSRMVKFERQARAEQQRFKAMLRDIIDRVIAEYTPFSPGVSYFIRFGDVVSDQQAVAEWLNSVGWAFHRDEVRELMDHEPWDEEDDREAPPELSPNAQEPDSNQPTGGSGGLFTRANTQDDDEEDEDDGTDADRHEPSRDEAPDPLHDDDKERYANGGKNLVTAYDQKSALNENERYFERIIEEVLWSDDTERQLFEFDPEEVPEFVVARLREAVQAGALFSNFETVPDYAASRVGDTLLDSLETQHGWSVDSITQNLMDMDVGLDRRDAEAIARTETQAIVNEAREAGYEEQFDLDNERFDWVGPNDVRTTDACEWIKSQIPESGVRLNTLQELIQEANDRFIESHGARKYTPHIQCRHTFTRQV